MTERKSSADGNEVEGPATQKYQPSNVAPPPEAAMRHELPGSLIEVEETSGIAAAEATGKLKADPEEDSQKTAGSG